MLGVKKRIAAFSDGTDICQGLAGSVGAGKLHLARQQACAKLFRYQVIDRAQGSIAYTKLGGWTLREGGLAQSLFIVCNAHESDWTFVSKLPAGAKFIFIANNESAIKGGKFPIAKLPSPTYTEMARIAWEELGWPIGKATRLAMLAEGDWRKLRALEQLFQNVDVAGMSEDDFQQAVLNSAKDAVLEAHPSAVVFDLFSGTAKGRFELYATPATLAWGERNLGIMCESLGQMATMQEAAVSADLLLSSTGQESDEHESDLARNLGLDHFVRSASNASRAGLRYDHLAFANPWAQESSTVEEIRSSFDRQRSSHYWVKRRRVEGEAQDDELIKLPRLPRATAKAKSKAKAAKGTTTKVATKK